MVLAYLYKCAEQIGSVYAPSANAAMRELESVSGVTVRVKAPLGGARTKAECNALGTSWTISDHWEGRGRALDVDNRGDITSGIARRRGITFNAAVTVYYQIWAKWGWHNITTDGQPFPSEPWHLANHSTQPAGSSGGAILINETRRRMLQLNYNPADPGTAAKPVYYVAGAGGVFRYEFASRDAVNKAAAAMTNGTTLQPSTFGLPSNAVGWAVLASWQTPPVSGAGPSGPLALSDADVLRVAEAVIFEQKKPGN